MNRHEIGVRRGHILEKDHPVNGPNPIGYVPLDDLIKRLKDRRPESPEREAEISAIRTASTTIDALLNEGGLITTSGKLRYFDYIAGISPFVHRDIRSRGIIKTSGSKARNFGVNNRDLEIGGNEMILLITPGFISYIRASYGQAQSARIRPIKEAPEELRKNVFSLRTALSTLVKKIYSEAGLINPYIKPGVVMRMSVLEALDQHLRENNPQPSFRMAE